MSRFHIGGTVIVELIIILLTVLAFVLQQEITPIGIAGCVIMILVAVLSRHIDDLRQFFDKSSLPDLPQRYTVEQALNRLRLVWIDNEIDSNSDLDLVKDAKDYLASCGFNITPKTDYRDNDGWDIYQVVLLDIMGVGGTVRPIQGQVTGDGNGIFHVMRTRYPLKSYVIITGNVVTDDTSKQCDLYIAKNELYFPDLELQLKNVASSYMTPVWFWENKVVPALKARMPESPTRDKRIDRLRKAFVSDCRDKHQHAHALQKLAESGQYNDVSQLIEDIRKYIKL